MLELDGVAKYYGKHVAVENVSFTVADGEFVTLLGPSGSGKSTILGMIAGFLSPDVGSIILDGKDVKRLPASRRDIGVVFQHYALFPHLNVRENIAYGLRRRRWSKKRIADRVAEMLDLINLSYYGSRRPSQLSGGQQQRVALARALAFEPRILLMDEPLGALDREIRAQMQEEIRRIHRELGPSILYVTHNKDEAFALSDRVGIMRDAGLVALASPFELYEAPSTTFVARFFANRQLLDVEVCENGDQPGSALAIKFAEHEAQIFTGRICAASGPAKLAIAPHAVTIESKKGGDATRKEASTDRLSLEARVEDTIYMGHVTQVHCRTDAGGQSVVAELESGQAKEWTAGRDVRVVIELEDAIVLADEAGTQS